MNGYKVAAEDVMSIVDKVSQVDLYSATDAGGLMEAMSRVSTMANTAGVSMDKLLAYLATTGEVTQRNMSSIGESFKTIFARMSDIKAQNYELVDEDGTVELLSDVESSLKKVGIDLRKTVTEYNDYDDVLDNLASKWNSLNEVQQNELSKAFAGVRQQEIFRTLMENYDRVKKYTELSENSMGTAEKKFNENYLSSLEAKTQSLKASLESLSSSLISDDMYAGVLDGTKAIVDFTEKTQILKGTLAGLGTAGGIFAFQKIGSWVGEAVKEFSNLGTAMDTLKVGKIDSSGFKDLLGLTQNLSKSQTELVLSSTALTDAQRIAILTGQGMSASEAEAAVSAMGLSTANATATASTVSLGSAMKGLFATLAANPLILVAAGVTAAVTAYSAYQQSVEESVSSAREAGQKFSENTSSLQDNIVKVQELRTQLASGTLSESEAYGVISLEEYNEKSAEYRKEIQSSASDVKSYQKSLTDLYQNALKTEVDALQKVINKRKEAAQAKGCRGMKVDFNEPSYLLWKNVIQRCYNRKIHKYKPEYKDKSVCEEWQNYANFKIWYDEHYVPDGNNQIDLDKDLLVQGNKVYSPETCVFLRHYQNTMFEGGRGDCISENKDGTFTVDREKKTATIYQTYEEAVETVIERRKEKIEKVAEMSKGLIPTCVYQAMLNWDVRAAMCG